MIPGVRPSMWSIGMRRRRFSWRCCAPQLIPGVRRAKTQGGVENPTRDHPRTRGRRRCWCSGLWRHEVVQGFSVSAEVCDCRHRGQQGGSDPEDGRARYAAKPTSLALVQCRDLRERVHVRYLPASGLVGNRIRSRGPRRMEGGAQLAVKASTGDRQASRPPNKPLERTGCAGRSAPSRWADGDRLFRSAAEGGP